MPDNQKNRTAVIEAARAVTRHRIEVGDMKDLVEALHMLDRSERVTEFQEGIRRRRIPLCEVGECWMRADHEGVCYPFNDGWGRCDYREDGLRCVMSGRPGTHTDHLMEDRKPPVKGDMGEVWLKLEQVREEKRLMLDQMADLREVRDNAAALLVRAREDCDRWKSVAQHDNAEAQRIIVKLKDELESFRTALGRVTQIPGNRGDWAILIAEEVLNDGKD